MMDKVEYSLLSHSLNDTTNSYKYFWFLALVDEATEYCCSASYRDGHSHQVSQLKMAARILSVAWYPTTQGLRYGEQDKIEADIDAINAILNLREGDPVPTVQSALENHFVQGIRPRVLRYVPYRFLTPWFAEELEALKGQDGKKNKHIKDCAKIRFDDPTAPVPYRFDRDRIEIHPDWLTYLFTNRTYLRAFALFELIKRLETHNPTATGIATSLEPPLVRDLEPARRLWKAYQAREGAISCIYSGQDLEIISLDHIVPWDLNHQDRIWNILPTSKSVNSSKGASIPALSDYGKQMADAQWGLFELFLDSQETMRESDYERHERDYALFLERSADELSDVIQNEFRTALLAQLERDIDLAQLSGIRTNWIYRG